MALTEREKDEIRNLAKSDSLREDMRQVGRNRHNPIMRDGKVDMELLFQFLNQYNEFINHEPKPFKPMIEKVMKL